MQPTTKRDSHPTTSRRSSRNREDAAAAGAVAGGLGALDDQGLCDCSQCGAADNVQRLEDLLWEFDEKDPATRRPGTRRSAATTS